MPRSFLDRGPLTVALGLLALVLTSSEAHSQAKPMTARVSELEQRIKKLEARLDAVEKRSSASAVARFPSPTDECNPAFVIDAQGIRRIKADCLDRAPRCDPPYTIDERGFRVPKPECL